MAEVQDCDLKANKFDLQSYQYVDFRNNSLREGMSPQLYLSIYGEGMSPQPYLSI